MRRVRKAAQVVGVSAVLLSLSGCSYPNNLGVSLSRDQVLSVFVPLCGPGQVTAVSLVVDGPRPFSTEDAPLAGFEKTPVEVLWRIESATGFGEEQWFVIGATEPGRRATPDADMQQKVALHRSDLLEVTSVVTHGSNPSTTFALEPHFATPHVLAPDGSLYTGAGSTRYTDYASVRDFEKGHCNPGGSPIVSLFGQAALVSSAFIFVAGGLLAATALLTGIVFAGFRLGQRKR